MHFILWTVKKKKKEMVFACLRLFAVIAVQLCTGFVVKHKTSSSQVVVHTQISLVFDLCISFFFVIFLRKSCDEIRPSILWHEI